MVEVGQLRRWKDGFGDTRGGTMCLVTERCDRGVDAGGNLRQRIFTVLMDDPDPWFYEQELEEYTVLVE
jgi:hypothetical protein